MSAGIVTTVRIVTPAGDFFVIGNIESYGRELVIRNLHIQSGGLRANSLGWARLRQIARAMAEKADVDSILIEGGARTTGAGRLMGASCVSSGSPARYVLSADQPLTKTISAIWALVKRHVPLIVAKRQIEEVMVGNAVVIDLPMLEDAAAFESEMRELGISAVRETPAAAAEG